MGRLREYLRVYRSLKDVTVMVNDKGTNCRDLGVSRGLKIPCGATTTGNQIVLTLGA